MTSQKHSSELVLKARRDFLQKSTRSAAGLSFASSALGGGLLGGRLLGGGLLVGGGLGGLSGCATEEKKEKAAFSPYAHPLTGLTTLKGEKFELPPLVGEVTLLDFWASWCAPCRQAFRYLDQLYQTYLPDGLRMVAICVDDEAADGLRFANRMRPHFDVAWDGEKRVKERFSVQSLPTTFLLDQEGRMVHRHSGFDLNGHRVLDEQVRRLVRGV